MTTWGARIEAGSLGYPVAGERPSYLSCRDEILWFASRDIGNPHIDAFQLPADHYAYRAIEAGFTPWGGGPDAPTDWDGGDVLRREGTVESATDRRWARSGAPWKHYPDIGNSENWDIIGYHKRTVPIAHADATYDQAVRLLNALTDRIGQSRAIPLPDTSGVIGQIDHVTTGMVVRDDATQLTDENLRTAAYLFDAEQANWKTVKFSEYPGKTYLIHKDGSIQDFGEYGDTSSFIRGRQAQAVIDFYNKERKA